MKINFKIKSLFLIAIAAMCAVQPVTAVAWNWNVWSWFAAAKPVMKTNLWNKITFKKAAIVVGGLSALGYAVYWACNYYKKYKHQQRVYNRALHIGQQLLHADMYRDESVNGQSQDEESFDGIDNILCSNNDTAQEILDIGFGKPNKVGMWTKLIEKLPESSQCYFGMQCLKKYGTKLKPMMKSATEGIAWYFQYGPGGRYPNEVTKDFAQQRYQAPLNKIDLATKDDMPVRRELFGVLFSEVEDLADRCTQLQMQNNCDEVKAYLLKLHREDREEISSKK